MYIFTDFPVFHFRQECIPVGFVAGGGLPRGVCVCPVGCLPGGVSTPPFHA